MAECSKVSRCAQYLAVGHRAFLPGRDSCEGQVSHLSASMDCYVPPFFLWEVEYGSHSWGESFRMLGVLCVSVL